MNRATISINGETCKHFAGLTQIMNYHAPLDVMDDDPDRKLIRVDPTAAQAGIAAALRRAFSSSTVGRDDINAQLDELLAQLH